MAFIVYELQSDPQTEVVVSVSNEEFDAQQQEAGLERVARGDDLMVRAKMKFEEAVERIGPIANAVLNKMQPIGESVNEVQVDIGVKYLLRLVNRLRQKPGWTRTRRPSACNRHTFEQMGFE
jgi:hypothetical protein